MTECTQSSFEFQAHFSREVVARFDGGTMTSDAGAVLLRETDRRLCARLRTADQDAAAGSKDEVERIVRQIRAVWPAVRIIVRADSGYLLRAADRRTQWLEQT
jgi:hypothetical protein